MKHQKGFGIVGIIIVVMALITAVGGGIYMAMESSDGITLPEYSGAAETDDDSGDVIHYEQNTEDKGAKIETETDVYEEVVVTAPEVTTYAVARTKNISYTCTFSVSLMAYFGSPHNVQAHVIGNDFTAVEVGGLYAGYARRGDWNYTWVLGEQGVVGVRIQRSKFEQETGNALDRDIIFNENKYIAMAFPNPGNTSSCVLGNQIPTVSMPDIEFRDYTDAYIDGYIDFVQNGGEEAFE